MNALVRILKAPKSYREAAQYFDGVSRQAIKGWVGRKEIPAKHLPGLRRIVSDYSLPYEEEDIRDVARASNGKLSMAQAERQFSCDWVNVQSNLSRYSRRFRVSKDIREDAVSHSILAMMEGGKTDISYGCICVKNYIVGRVQEKETVVPDDFWEGVAPRMTVAANQISRIELWEVLRSFADVPERYRKVLEMLAIEESEDIIAGCLGVGRQSVRSYSAHARRMLIEVMSAKDRGERAVFGRESKLSDRDIVEIRRTRKFYTIDQHAEKYGVSKGTIVRARRAP